MPVMASEGCQALATMRAWSSAPKRRRPGTAGSSPSTPGRLGRHGRQVGLLEAGTARRELGEQDLAGALRLRAGESSWRSSRNDEGDHPAGQSAVHALGEHIDPDVGHQRPAQRRGAATAGRR